MHTAHLQTKLYYYKKYDVTSQPEMKKFSIDPELTNFQMLRDTLKTAFDIKCDFIISYLVPGFRGAEDRYLPMLSEWDLNTAIYGASDPILTLKVDLKAGLDEWDIIEQEDLQSCLFEDTIPASGSSAQNGNNNELSNINERTLTASVGNLLQKSWFGSSSALKNGKTPNADWIEKSKTNSPLTENQFRSYFDAEGRMLRPDLFRLSVYQGGMECTLRPTVWKFLLNIYPTTSTTNERTELMLSVTEKYFLLRDTVIKKFKTGLINEELRLVANAVRKDVIRTDRTHPFFAGNEDENKNLMSLFNLLTTYALAHPEVSYCQGMSDLASPLLIVMQNEAEAYICFCALMRRMRRNFSCDGRSMTKKFSHLSELLQHYDPVFYNYLREMHADDLLFCYRWLLLELKREFSFENALVLTEVTWASLPNADDRKSLELFDVDITACENDFEEEENYCMQANPALASDKISSSSSFVQPHLDGNTLFGYVMDFDSSDEDDDAFNKIDSRLRPISVSSTRSCPVNMVQKGYGVCPAAVVRSLMLHESESARLHALRHASYPPKRSAQSRNLRRRNTKPRFTIGAGPDAELCNELAELTAENNLHSKVKRSQSLATSRSVESLHDAQEDVIDVNQEVKVNPVVEQKTEILADIQALDVFSGEDHNQSVSPVADLKAKDDFYVKRVSRINDKDAKRRYTMDEKAIRSKRPTYSIKPSTEFSVTDEDIQELQKPNRFRDQSPVPVAHDASVEASVDGGDEDESRQLTLTEIHDLCLMQSSATSTTSAEDGDASRNVASDDRSRQPSGGCSTTTVPNAHNGCNQPVVSSNKSRHASSSANGGCATTNFDSGFSDASNNTAPCGVSSVEDASSRAGDSNFENLFADVLECANNDKDSACSSRPTLPLPKELGDGNPFMLFVSLTLLLQHRDAIMKKRMDFNEIAIHFDKLMKKHNVRKVLKRARILYADYLKCCSPPPLDKSVNCGCEIELII